MIQYSIEECVNNIENNHHIIESNSTINIVYNNLKKLMNYI